MNYPELLVNSILLNCLALTFCAGNPCSHICAIVNGKTRCFCPLGFQLAAGSTTRCEGTQLVLATT